MKSVTVFILSMLFALLFPLAFWTTECDVIVLTLILIICPIQVMTANPKSLSVTQKTINTIFIYTYDIYIIFAFHLHDL